MVVDHQHKAKYAVEEMCANISVEEIAIDLPEDQKFTDDECPQKYIEIENVQEEVIHKTFRIYKHFYRYKAYADPMAKKIAGAAYDFHPRVLAHLLLYSYASALLDTELTIKKYCEALQMYWQEKLWKHLGVNLKQNAFATMEVLIVTTYLNSFRDAFHAEVII